jgi:hypothetical protein
MQKEGCDFFTWAGEFKAFAVTVIATPLSLSS